MQCAVPDVVRWRVTRMKSGLRAPDAKLGMKYHALACSESQSISRISLFVKTANKLCDNLRKGAYEDNTSRLDRGWATSASLLRPV